jgi:GTP-binding protein
MLAEFHSLGFDLLPVSAEHGHNVRTLEEEIRDRLPQPEEDAWDEEELPDGPAMLYPSRKDAPDAPLKLCMLGRPNAGKSSLVNALLGETRMIVSDVAGTTRDSVDIPFRLDKKNYVFVDTAGVRRRTRISDVVERFSVNSSLKSTSKAHVTLLVLDVSEGLTAQDKRLIELLDERKTPFLILLNKMDLVPPKQRRSMEKELSEAVSFCPHVPVLPVSALNRHGLQAVLPTAERIYDECGVRIGTGQLNRAMEETLTRYQAPVVRRVRPKFFYLTQAESQPPTFIFFVNDAERVAESYVRYLEKSLRRLLGIKHAPMRLHLRSSHGKNKEKK